jgi:3-methyl-2-oxobutanoate hydroxymethyltransferase
MSPISLKDIQSKAKHGEKIVMLTAYDYPTGLLLDQAGVDIILVGDSLANVVLGLSSTRDVGMEEMLHHAKAVRRAVKHAFLIGDMPYESYQLKSSDAVKNAKRFIKEAGCDAVKLEWFDGCLNIAKKIIKAGIPLMGHVGLTPQTAEKLGGFKVQGKDRRSAKKILEHAIALEEAGCFSIVLECIPTSLGKGISEKLKIPTIGIGAGKYCDGQVLVTHDLLGLGTGFHPKFVKTYVDVSKSILKGVQTYCSEVRRGTFPDKAHSYEDSPNR